MTYNLGNAGMTEDQMGHITHIALRRKMAVLSITHRNKFTFNQLSLLDSVYVYTKKFNSLECIVTLQ